jgi:hypothetical protein
MSNYTPFLAVVALAIIAVLLAFLVTRGIVIKGAQFSLFGLISARCSEIRTIPGPPDKVEDATSSEEGPKENTP